MILYSNNFLTLDDSNKEKVAYLAVRDGTDARLVYLNGPILDSYYDSSSADRTIYSIDFDRVQRNSLRGYQGFPRSVRGSRGYQGDSVSGSYLRWDSRRGRVSADIYASAFYQISDMRFKENIEDLPDVLNILLDAPIFIYNLLDDEGNVISEDLLGSSVQYFEQRLPELVNEDTEGCYSLDYASLSAVLIKALQELTRDELRL